jgi:hypothetical protein
MKVSKIPGLGRFGIFIDDVEKIIHKIIPLVAKQLN